MFQKKSNIDYKFNEGALVKELQSYIDKTYEGHYSKNQFQFQSLVKSEKFWNDADNHSINFYEVCKQVIENAFHGTPNQFKNVAVGVGAMTLKV